MAITDLRSLLSQASSDPGLRQRLNAADANPLLIAAELGLSVTADDLRLLQSMTDTDLEMNFAGVIELSDGDLASISGGNSRSHTQLREQIAAQCGSCWAFSTTN